MGPIAHIVGKAGALDSVVSAMGYTVCFSTTTSSSTAIGLGFLQECKGLFIFTLLPLFAVVALLANALGWLSHRQWYRSLLGMTGSATVFTETVWLFGNWWTTRLVYTDLALIIGASVWDLVPPADRRCGPDGCEFPTKHGRQREPAANTEEE